MRLASERLGAPVDQLKVKDGVVTRRRAIRRGRRATARSWAAGSSASRSIRTPGAGTPANGPCSASRCRGSTFPPWPPGSSSSCTTCGSPGCCTGRSSGLPPWARRSWASTRRPCRDVPGLVKVVVKKNFVGRGRREALAGAAGGGEAEGHLEQGRRACPTPRDFHEYLRRQQPTRDTLLVDSKDVDEKLAQAATVVKATYLHPYQMHGSLGSSCAVADVQGDKATIWSPTQAVHPHRKTAAMVLGLRPENVRVIFRMGSGCYGLNGAEAVSYDAALLSQAVGKPVRVQLTRKDEMAWENYGLAFVVDQRAGLDAAGHDRRLGLRDVGAVARRPAGHGPPRQRRHRLPGRLRAGAVRSALAGAGSRVVQQRQQRRARPTSRAAWGRSRGGTGTVESERVLTHAVRSPFWTGPLRSPQRLQNTFAHECFMDELAQRVKADPARLPAEAPPRSAPPPRADHGGEAAGWEARPSPRPSAGRKGIAAGRGIACVLYEGDNGYCAMVAEVEVDQDTRRRRGEAPRRRPRLRARVEPGRRSGTRSRAAPSRASSRALGEEVTWDDQRVTSVDWRSYRSLVPRLRGSRHRDRARRPARRARERGRRDLDHRGRRRRSATRSSTPRARACGRSRSRGSGSRPRFGRGLGLLRVGRLEGEGEPAEDRARRRP